MNLKFYTSVAKGLIPTFVEVTEKKTGTDDLFALPLPSPPSRIGLRAEVVAKLVMLSTSPLTLFILGL